MPPSTLSISPEGPGSQCFQVFKSVPDRKSLQMSQKDLNTMAAEAHEEQEPFSQEPFSQEPFSQDPFSQGPFSQEPFSQESFSQEDPGPGGPDISGEAGEDMPVEEAFARLEQLIRRMESEDITLEDSFACYEQGIRLVRYCNERIDRVEKKVQMLQVTP